MGNSGSFNPNDVFTPSWTSVADVALDTIDPVNRSETEKTWRKVCGFIPILDELEKIERGAQVHVCHKIQQHHMHKEDFRKVFPDATEKCLDAMAAVTNGDIEPLAASIIIKREMKK